MTALLQRLIQAWRRFSPLTRSVTIVVPAFGVATFWAIVTFAMPHPTALFASPLETEQLSEVDSQLAAWNVAHVTTADNVEIDSGTRNATLLRLSLAGMPHAHIATTNETLAKASALTPDALLEAQSRTGLAGDVAVALRSIDGVSDASVVIAPARQATFTDQESSAASASVRLSLRPGVVLSQDAIDGIRAFVSSAVPLLAREHVVLLDDHGVALGVISAATSDEAERARNALQSAFDTAFGAGTTIVRVHAIYQQRAERSHVTERLPVNGAPLVLQHSDERYKSKEKQYSKDDTSEDHGSIVRDNESTTVVGALEHLSVAVFVDQTRGIDLEKVQNLALAATGIVERDYVHVEAVNFVHASKPTGFAFAACLDVLMMVVPYLALAFGGLVCFRMAHKPLRMLVRGLLTQERIRETAIGGTRISPGDVRGMLADEPPHTAAAVISALPAATATAVLDLYESSERAAIVARMARQASAFAPTWEHLHYAR